MLIDGVFAGGGIKALAFVGALEVLDKKNIQFERIAGTSAGAITAAFIKSGYNGAEIEQMFADMQFQQLLDPRIGTTIFPFLRWLRLYRKMGIYKGNEFEQWVDKLLKKKGVSTFSDFPEGSLKMIASDITNGRILVLPDDLTKYGIIPHSFSVARAIRMSCSLPFFFEPVKLTDSDGKESLIVDGGVLSNFPMWIFQKRGQKHLKRPVIGFRLTPSLDAIPPRQVTNALSMLTSMFDTMRNAHDQRYISKNHAKNVVFIPVEDVSTTQFTLSDQDKLKLIELGKTSTEKFLKKWSY
ncbi:patatin-like phospholipase family protein [Bacillus shivajii]|uniref:patatin-like phospholipase family protein n=1 Tax=Bacillus shivajii TaxID=1983719 RepID=UPI001CFBB3EA|nr:patatin-like phospholipase family protein [Bacillus shivajii]UCZ54590.1 patatin-like phospholipase family protein [Bacillus shivajii]